MRVPVPTEHGGRSNVMAAAWVMPLDFAPPKFVACIAADTFTRELLDAAGECVLHAPTPAQVDLTYAVGSRSGRDGDKFALLGIDTEPGTQVAAPLLRAGGGRTPRPVTPEARKLSARIGFLKPLLRHRRARHCSTTVIVDAENTCVVWS